MSQETQDLVPVESELKDYLTTNLELFCVYTNENQPFRDGVDTGFQAVMNSLKLDSVSYTFNNYSDFKERQNELLETKSWIFDEDSSKLLGSAVMLKHTSIPIGDSIHANSIILRLNRNSPEKCEKVIQMSCPARGIVPQTILIQHGSELLRLGLIDTPALTKSITTSSTTPLKLNPYIELNKEEARMRIYHLSTDGLLKTLKRMSEH